MSILELTASENIGLPSSELLLSRANRLPLWLAVLLERLTGGRALGVAGRRATPPADRVLEVLLQVFRANQKVPKVSHLVRAP